MCMGTGWSWSLEAGGSSSAVDASHSAQLGPTFTSTFSGTARSITPDISSRTSAASAGGGFGRRFEQQLVVDLQQHPRRRAALRAAGGGRGSSPA